MLKTLRRKFIWSAVLSFASAIVLILSIINIINYHSVISDLDARIGMLSRGEIIQQEPQGKKDGDPSQEETKPAKNRMEGFFGLGPRLSNEAMMNSGYFSVTIAQDGTVAEIDTGKAPAVDDAAAESYALLLYGENHFSGMLNTYRYKGLHLNGATKYIFLDCSREISTMYSFLAVSIFAALIGLCVVTVLIVICSKMAIAPVAESYDKQKQFITDASHELKTPLAVINAANEVTEMETGETEWTQSIHKQIARLSSLTEKLVMLSRMDEESYKPDTAVFSLSDAVKETAESFLPVAQYKKKNYTIDIEDGISYEGDETSLRQLVSLLVDNAMKYSDDNGDIRLTLRKNGRTTELKVENTANGLQKGDQSILFERFYRADQSRNASTGGHGIGLSVAKAIVTSHKGKISAVSPDGRRIVFTALL